MPERAKIKTQIKNQSGLTKLIQESRGTAKAAQKRGSSLTINLQRVIKGIEAQPYDDDIKKELIKIASKVPQGGLMGFWSSLNTHIAAIQRNKKGPEVVQKPAIIGQRKQEQHKSPKVENPKIENLFFDDTEEIKIKKQVEIQPQVQSPTPKTQPSVQSREEVVAGMDARRAFAKRLQELQDYEEPEEWLK